jgi:hypothetical protein
MGFIGRLRRSYEDLVDIVVIFLMLVFLPLAIAESAMASLVRKVTGRRRL